MDDGKIKLTSKVKNNGSKSANFSTMPKTEELAMVEAFVNNEKDNLTDKDMVVTDEQIDNAIVYSDSITSIDVMMPDEEREIVEKNLNIYSNVKQTQQILNTAKINKKLSEDIKTLEIIDKTGLASMQMLEVLNDPANLETLSLYIQRRFEEGDIAKAYKEVATASKIMLDARQELVKQLAPQSNKKKTRIALKFTNDSGEDFQLGVDI